MSRVTDTRDDARRIRETFMSSPPKRETTVPFTWPKAMDEVGKGKSIMYRSNKWKKNPQDWEDYKHVAEGPQVVMVTPGFLREWDRPTKRLAVDSERVQLIEPMPKHFAVLAPFLGLQFQPYGSEDFYEVTVAHATIGGAKHPKTGEKFLFVYTKAGVHMLVTGSELDIEKDGIVG